MSSALVDSKTEYERLPTHNLDAGPIPTKAGKSVVETLTLACLISLFTLTWLSQWSVAGSFAQARGPNMDLSCATPHHSTSWRCQEPRKHAEKLLSHHPLIDGHVDVPVISRYRYGNKVENIPFDQPAFENGSYPTYAHVDVPRLREGKSGGFFWSAYVECPDPATIGDDFEHAGSHIAVRDTLEQLDVIRQMTDKYSDFWLVRTASAARHAFKRGKLISFIGIEGAHSLGNSLFALRAFASMFSTHAPSPLRYLTLTHTCHNAFADSAGENPKRWGGLSPFAPHLIHELNRLAIVPDLSHVSDDTALQTIDMTKGPVMLSHSAARVFEDLERNVPDSVLKKLASSGKDHVVMINIYPGFIGGDGDLDQVIRHIDHLSSILGATMSVWALTLTAFAQCQRAWRT